MTLGWIQTKISINGMEISGEGALQTTDLNEMLLLEAGWGGLQRKQCQISLDPTLCLLYLSVTGYNTCDNVSSS